jgi:hypothetical protein
MGTRSKLTTYVSIVALGLFVSSANGRPIEDVSATARFKPGDNSRGLSIRWRVTVRDDRGGQVSPLKRFELRLPRRTMANLRVFPSCKIGELPAPNDHKSRTCPRRAVVGTGHGSAQRLPLLQTFDYAATMVNSIDNDARHLAAIHLAPTAGPPLGLSARFVRKQHAASALEIEVPRPAILLRSALPTPAITSFDLTIDPKPLSIAGRQVPYLTATKSCSSTQTMSGRFEYEDGSVNAVEQRLRIVNGKRCKSSR